MSPLSRRALASGFILAGALAFGSPSTSAADRGFAISWFQPAYNIGDDDCPQGVTQELDWKAVFEKEGRSPEEIAKLIANPVSQEFRKAALGRGPHGEDVCANPAVLADTSWKTVQGAHAYGMNVDGTSDGAATPKTCAHQKFTGVDGAPGVDNQLYRVMGCSKAYRGSRAKDGHDSFGIQYLNERMREGLVTYLIEVAGITDPRNSDNVEVGIYQGIDPLVQDATGGVAPDTTLRIGSDTRWQAHAHGRIKDGVLTTDVFDLDLRNDAVWLPEFHFRQARLKLEMKDDGSLKGIMAGYQDWISIYWGMAKTGALGEKFSTMNCPAIYNAFQRLADGDPDPKTGECRSVSAAYEVEAVPAFLIHPADSKGSKTAQSGGPKSEDAPVRSAEAR